jgi:hypothetical protein
MSENQASGRGGWVRRKLAKLIIVLAGVVLGQAVLYGPSLAGRKILLPLDMLAAPGVYLPATPGSTGIEAHNSFLGDLVYLFEPARRFAASEFRAGRLPTWVPNDYAGAPFVWPKFSPFLALQCCVESPVVLAWTQLLAAVVASLGAYLFFRRVLGISFWPATVAAWCYPISAFFIFWQGYATGLAVYWLPWLLLMVDNTVRGRTPGAPLWLTVVTCLVLVSGHLDVAGQVLLASGLYALWCLFDAFPRQWFGRQARKAVLALVAAWGLGFLLAAPYILPVLDYTRASTRISRRSAGEEERPPVGLTALPQTVLPDLYGSLQTGSVRLFDSPEIESSAATYCGLLATLLVAPLAWCSRRHRAINVFWGCLSFIALGWCLNVPGLVHLLRLPGANMLSHNRFVFAASFAILAMTAVGLEVLRQGPVRWRRWLCVPPALLAGLCAWCAYRAVFPSEPVDTQLGLAVLQGTPLLGIRDLQGVERVRSWFAWHYGAAAGLCGLGLVGWWLIWSGYAWRFRLLPALGVVLVGDLLWFGYGRSSQCDPALYYPPIPVLAEVAKAAPGRVMGCDCLPPNLARMCGLHDIRGYDSLDPARLAELELMAADPKSTIPTYARTQWLIPKTTVTSGGDVQLSPILDMLSVRYLIFRGPPDPRTHPAFHGPDYWVLVNPDAMPRAYVPKRVEFVADNAAQLRKLASPEFDPREVAYVVEPFDLPGRCQGKADIVSEIPTRVTVALHMDTPGLVVLADLWDKGWRAYLNGRPAPILRANHALRGVVVPAGSGTLEFRYAPASFAWGLRLAVLAGIALLGWLGVIVSRRRASMTSDIDR